MCKLEAAPKMALALASEQAKGRGMSLGKGGMKLLLKFWAHPCQFLDPGVNEGA